jgi:hypothetical protein
MLVLHLVSVTLHGRFAASIEQDKSGLVTPNSMFSVEKGTSNVCAPVEPED